MSKPPRSSATILIASTNTSDATLVKNLLLDEFSRVFVSTDAKVAAADFDQQKPDVLVLAFGALEQAERYNLGLFRQSREIHGKPHRTIVLCHKDEVQRAYELCRDDIFNDYHLFWPMAHDATRLSMAVHHALRALKANQESGPTPREFADQIHRLGELEAFLRQRLTEGDEHIASNGRALAEAEQKIASAFTGFSRRMSKGEMPELVEVRNAKGLEDAFDQFNHEAIAGPLQAVTATVRPLEQWAKHFRQASAPHLDSIRSLHALANEVKPTVMVVDDDDFQHKLVGMLLAQEGYRLVLASSGIEALNLLHKLKPDLILMDFAMPDMDGLEVTRRIKGVARFETIPIIMITGNSEQEVVSASLKAGASDFLVKPLNRETLVAKINRLLAARETPSQEALVELKVSDL